MSRTPRIPVDYEVQLHLLDTKIEKYKTYVSDLQAQRQDLMAKQQEANLRDLVTFMKQNSMTAKEVIQELSSIHEVAAAAICEPVEA